MKAELREAEKQLQSWEEKLDKNASQAEYQQELRRREGARTGRCSFSWSWEERRLVRWRLNTSDMGNFRRTSGKSWNIVLGNVITFGILDSASRKTWECRSLDDRVFFGLGFDAEHWVWRHFSTCNKRHQGYFWTLFFRSYRNEDFSFRWQ